MDFRTGDFSSLLPSGIVIADPATGLPFPNNRIPADRLDPDAAAFMGFTPAPNRSSNALGANNYLSQSLDTRTNEDQLVARLDYHPSPGDALSARYIFDELTAPNEPPLFGDDETLNTADGHNLAVSWTHTFLADVHVERPRGMEPVLRAPGVRNHEQAGIRHRVRAHGAPDGGLRPLQLRAAEHPGRLLAVQGARQRPARPHEPALLRGYEGLTADRPAPAGFRSIRRSCQLDLRRGRLPEGRVWVRRRTDGARRHGSPPPLTSSPTFSWGSPTRWCSRRRPSTCTRRAGTRTSMSRTAGGCLTA